MPVLAPADYVNRRQAYSYSDDGLEFSVHQTGGLPFHGCFHGLFPGVVPGTRPNGINLAKFELICQSVFGDAANAYASHRWTTHHLENLKAVVYGIVHWKMASQGGRAERSAANVLRKWDATTHGTLIYAYGGRSVQDFKIGGVRIPTASAFLRFLFPNEFGVIDRRVVTQWTQRLGFTTLSLRRTDGYVNDVVENVEKYSIEYVPFLQNEAAALASLRVTFADFDAHGRPINRQFRPCDIEMALF